MGVDGATETQFAVQTAQTLQGIQKPARTIFEIVLWIGGYGDMTVYPVTFGLAYKKNEPYQSPKTERPQTTQIPQ